MASLNKVMLIGNLGADPETRRLSSGDPVVNFRIATSDTWRDKSSGEKRERTEWHSIVIFNSGLAGVAEKYLKKGSRVYVEGKLQTRKWQDKDGIDRYSTEIVLQNYVGTLVILSERKSEGGGNQAGDDRGGYGGGGGGGQRGGYGDQSGGGYGGQSRQASRDLDDEIPF